MHTARLGRLVIILTLGPGVVACTSADVPAIVGMTAPEVIAVTLQGDTVALSSLVGEPILLNLWATWCVPCRRETPYLQALHQSRAEQGLNVVGVALDRRGSEPEIREFVAEFGVGYTVLHDPDMTSLERFAAPGLPATYLIDRGGTIRYAVPGPVEEGNRAFEAALSGLLERAPRP